MITFNLGFTKYGSHKLYDLAQTIVTNVLATPAFSSLYSSTGIITTAAGSLEAAIAMPRGPARDASIKTARATLIVGLQALGEGLPKLSGVTDVDLAGSGFPLHHAAVHTSLPPDAPQDLRVRVTGLTGELHLLFKKVKRADFYEVEFAFDPVSGPWTLAPAFNSTRGIILRGLTRGKDYFVRARAVATNQNRGPWSDIASAMVS